MPNFQTVLLGLTLLIVSVTAHGQQKPDLEVSVQTASDIARGGEPFAYKITVRNIGPVKANDVILLNRYLRTGDFVTATPTVGTCEFDKPRDSATVVRCRLGEIEAGSSATIDVAIKLYDLGDSSIPIDQLESPFDRTPTSAAREATKRSARLLVESALAAQGKTRDDLPDPLITTLSSVDVAGDSVDENRVNNVANVSVKLLPSRNIPPRIKILSPAADSVFTKRARTPFKLTIEIESFDPDGYIDKILVTEPFYQRLPFVEDGQYKFFYMGRKFTAKELEEFGTANPPLKKLAVKSGPKTYTFTVTNVVNGRNLIDIVAIDNGGRRESVVLEVVVNDGKPTGPAN